MHFEMKRSQIPCLLQQGVWQDEIGEKLKSLEENASEECTNWKLSGKAKTQGANSIYICTNRWGFRTFLVLHYVGIIGLNLRNKVVYAHTQMQKSDLCLCFFFFFFRESSSESLDSFWNVHSWSLQFNDKKHRNSWWRTHIHKEAAIEVIRKHNRVLLEPVFINCCKNLMIRRINSHDVSLSQRTRRNWMRKQN